MLRLNPEQASSLLRLPLSCVSREYPNAPGYVLNAPEDLRSPREVHPAFYGCFDWHSAVHSHWTMVRLMRLFDLPQAIEARRLLLENLSAPNVQAEADYLSRFPSFERMYGWAWVLKLASELRSWADKDAAKCSQALSPLENVVVSLLHEYLPKLTYPHRVGTHGNTAFALTLILDYAREAGDAELDALVCRRARDYFEKDAKNPSHLEPGGADFLSPSLCEANLMQRVLEPERFEPWFRRFLPIMFFTPASVSDRSDPQIGHLDGLNLSRAWCMRGIAATLDDGQRKERLSTFADEHEDASLPHVASSHYSGEHWLATFAVLAMTA